MIRPLTLALVLLALAAPAFAQSAEDRGAIQAVINGQVQAFQRDDGPAAYAAASPGIQSKFSNPALFMAMVAGGYAPVYRPKSFVFGELEVTPAGPVQHVFLVGPDGLSYRADYLMARQADGTWKIDGVSLVRDDQPSI